MPVSGISRMRPAPSCCAGRGDRARWASRAWSAARAPGTRSASTTCVRRCAPSGLIACATRGCAPRPSSRPRHANRWRTGRRPERPPLARGRSRCCWRRRWTRRGGWRPRRRGRGRRRRAAWWHASWPGWAAPWSSCNRRNDVTSCARWRCTRRGWRGGQSRDGGTRTRGMRTASAHARGSDVVVPIPVSPLNGGVDPADRTRGRVGNGGACRACTQAVAESAWGCTRRRCGGLDSARLSATLRRKASTSGASHCRPRPARRMAAAFWGAMPAR